MPSIGDIVRVDLVGEFNQTEDVVNSFRYEIVAAPASNGDLLDDLKELIEIIVNIIDSVAAALMVWRSIRAYNESTSEVLGEAFFDTPIAGKATGQPGAPHVAALLTMPTGIGRVVLRKYIGPVAESNIDDDGRWFATNASNIATAMAGVLIGNQNATNGTYRYGHFTQVVGAFVSPNAVVANTSLATQRRRRYNVGS